MTDHLEHRCTESECCYTGQPSPKGCGCHQTREQMASARIECLEAKVRAVMRHIPMDYLQRHDKAGATGPTEVLNLEAAMKDYAEDRWKALDRIKAVSAINAELLEALTEILGPLNICSDNPHVRDDECLPVDMTMGELRKARAAIASAQRIIGEGE